MKSWVSDLYTEFNSQETLYSTLAIHDVSFFVMNAKLYILDGTNYLVYDGTTVSEITPYIPTLTVSNAPTGGGTSLEDFNLLGSGFKEEFSGTGSATTFQLSLKDLDAATVKANVDATDKTEGTDFTVDRTNGTVTFNTAPSSGTNNVIITAYKTYSGKPLNISKCTFSAEFGGNNDSHIFVSGNPDYPNRTWRSGVYDPTYFPENGFYNVGSNGEKIQGFSKQYDYLVIEKEHSKWNMQYQLSSDGTVSFPIKPINDKIGTYAPKTIQNILNNPVSLSETGVYELTSTTVRDQNNVKQLSISVNKQLLLETDLEKAISVDFDNKYWLVVNGKGYIFDYQIGEWYIYDNINANCFMIYKNHLYFGSSEGVIYRFKDSTDLYPYNDDGNPINAYWKSKLILFHVPERLKLVERVFLGLKPGDHTSCDVYVRTDRVGEYLAFTTRVDQLDFNNFDFSKYTFLTSDAPQEAGKKVKLKKINDVQLTLKNDQLDESLGILSLGIKYRYLNEVK